MANLCALFLLCSGICKILLTNTRLSALRKFTVVIEYHFLL